MKENPITTYYNKYSEVYHKPEYYFDSIAEKIVLLIGNRKEISLLDIGCGFGNFLTSFKKIIGAKGVYTGLTIANHEVDSIKENLSFITPILGNQEELESFFKGKLFDVVINFCTLSYLVQSSQVKVVEDMTRFLTQDGLLVLGFIDDWVKEKKSIKQYGKGYVQFYYSPAIFRHLSQQAVLLESFKKDNYRIQVWKKSAMGNHVAGYRLLLWYVLRNQILHVGLLKKIIKKITTL